MSSPDGAIAYLISAYPGTSHTFISREVAALRELGLPLDTFSIKPATDAELQDEELRRQAADTFIVRRQPITSFAWAQLAMLSSAPTKYFRVLLKAFGHRPPGVRAFAMALVYFSEAVLLARELKRRGTRWLHNHFGNAGAITGVLAAELLEIPWSFTMHGISETDYPAGLLLGKKIAAARFVACVSYFGRAQAMRTIGPSHWSKLHVIRCGVPFDALPHQATSKSRRRVVSVGRLSPEKGQAGLLQAFRSVLSHSPDAELVLVGDGPEAVDLKALAVELGIWSRVTFTGRLGEHETLERIAASDVFVLPSFMEGLPVVLMEAMALGTPVIASRVAGIPELVEDGRSGLLFTPSKWDELAASMRRMLEDDELRKELARNARVTIGRDFDIQKSARQLRILFAGRA